MTPWMATGAAGVLALTVGAVLRIRRRRKSAAERERERRLAVNAVGRIADGVLVEADRFDAAEPVPGLVFYSYKAKGVEYSAAQDISTLLPLTPSAVCSPGIPIQVKYHPQRPSDSIILCEQWSGLPVGAAARESGIRNSESGIAAR